MSTKVAKLFSLVYSRLLKKMFLFLSLLSIWFMSESSEVVVSEFVGKKCLLRVKRITITSSLLLFLGIQKLSAASEFIFQS